MKGEDHNLKRRVEALERAVFEPSPPPIKEMETIIHKPADDWCWIVRGVNFLGRYDKDDRPHFWNKAYFHGDQPHSIVPIPKELECLQRGMLAKAHLVNGKWEILEIVECNLPIEVEWRIIPMSKKSTALIKWHELSPYLPGTDIEITCAFTEKEKLKEKRWTKQVSGTCEKCDNLYSHKVETMRGWFWCNFCGHRIEYCLSEEKTEHEKAIDKLEVQINEISKTVKQLKKGVQ